MQTPDQTAAFEACAGGKTVVSLLEWLKIYEVYPVRLVMCTVYTLCIPTCRPEPEPDQMQHCLPCSFYTHQQLVNLIVLGFKNTSTFVGYFVVSNRKGEKR